MYSRYAVSQKVATLGFAPFNAYLIYGFLGLGFLQFVDQWLWDVDMERPWKKL